jgi:LysM repeat protein
MKKTTILAVLLSIVLLGSAAPLQWVFAQNTIAELTPGSQNIQVDQVTTVTFRVQDVDMLYGYQASIGFDPTVVEVVDADQSSAGVQVSLGNFLQADFVQQNSADNAAGTVVCVVSQLAPTAAVSGTGNLFVITFRGKAQGQTSVQFTDLKLAKSDGTEIVATQQDALITVGDVNTPTSTPTATSTPTSTPTPTPTGTYVTPTPTPTGTYIAPTATPTATPSPGQTVIYVVRTGDTLYSIARRFGVTVAAIAQINNISNTRYIQVGQRLLIPRSGNVTPVPQPPTPQPGPVVYIVQRGDTLYSIARRYGTTVEAIAIQNHIVNPSLIYAGQRLVITGSVVVPPPHYGKIHTVRAGETLYSIARRYGTTFWAIAVANHLSNPNIIYVGQRLVIP